MKVKVIKDCYYNLEFIKAGRIIEFEGEKLPSWATLADGIEEAKEAKKQEKSKAKKQEENVDTLPDDKAKDDNEYLETLINAGIEKGILIEDADKKSVKEQIKELEEALKEGK